MVWEVVPVISPKAASNPAFISLSGGKVNFSSEFIYSNKLQNAKYIKYLVDQADWKVGFLFLAERTDDECLTLGSKKTQNHGRRAGADTLLRKYPFIAQMMGAKNAADRRFVPVMEKSSHGTIWSISLAPIFEASVARNDAAAIPNDSTGVYRYRRGDEIVYIGKGQIRRRLQEPQRAEWVFDTIEFANINCAEFQDQEKKQLRWERYWIKKFKSENHGARPAYNRNDGISEEE